MAKKTNKVENKIVDMFEKDGIKKVDFSSKKVNKYIEIEDSDIVILNLNHKDNNEVRVNFSTFVLETIKNANGGEVEFTESILLKKLLPMVSNVDFSDLTDEEIEDIIESPTDDLIQARNIINDMIYKVFDNFVKAVKLDMKHNKIAGK